MARLRLGRREIKEFELPPVCAKCGRPAVAHPTKTFSWHPSWVIVLIFVGLLIYVIVALILTKRMKVRLPFCERHRNYWRNRLIFNCGGLLALVFVGIVGGVAVAALDPGGQNGFIAVFWVSMVLTFLVWLIWAAIMQSNTIRPNEITNRSIILVGLSEDFVDAVDDDRDAADEEYDRKWQDRARDDTDMPRANRRTAEDAGDYYDPKEKRRLGPAPKDVGAYYEDRKGERRRHREDDEDDR